MMDSKKYLPLALLFLLFSISFAARERGAWVSGNTTIQAPGNYVDRRIASSRSFPGARFNHQVAYDETRQEMFVFGGSGFGRPNISALLTLDDLWSFRLNDSTWTWLSGEGLASSAPTYSGTTYPGSRYYAASWYDPTAREFFLFGGGDGVTGVHDDVWRYRLTDSTWTWMNGTTGNSGPGFVGPVGVYGPRNTPGNRNQMCYVYDRFKKEGYLFGGVNSVNGVYGDLWKIRFNDSYWAIVSGNLTVNLRPNTAGKGVANPTFNPSSRVSPACAIDDIRGEIYVFGGRGYNSAGSISILNDLWRFRINDSTWTWLAGELSGAQPGVYGTRGSGVAGVTVPGSRYEAAAWFDPTKLQLGLFGGRTGTPFNTFADSWIYDVASNTWTWISGPQNATDNVGSYPPRNTATTAYNVSARYGSSIIYDSKNLQRVLFGGSGTSNAARNDAWLFQQYENCSSILAGVSGSSCLRYNDTDALLVSLSVPIAVLAPNITQCSQILYPTAVVSSCGSVECVRPSVCAPLGNASDFSSVADLCFTNYEPGACPNGSACNDLGTCKLLLGESCATPSQCYSNFCESPGRCCPTACNSSQVCTSQGECKMRPGQGCNVNEDCVTGSCGSNGICCNRVCDQPGSACGSGTGECLSRFGQNCTGSQPNCFEGLCSQAGLCCAQNCPAGLICIGGGGCLRFNGSPCSFDTDCISGFCTSSGFCCAQDCSSTEGCGTDGVCKTLTGSQCVDDSSCITGYCGLNSKCCLAPNCTCNDVGQCLKPLSALCTSNSECLSGVCSASGHCCASNCSGNCQDCSSGSCFSIQNALSSRCPSLNCSLLVAGWQSNDSAICQRFDGVIGGYCDATAACNTSALRCVAESSIVPIAGSTCLSTECKSDCPRFEQVSLYSNPRSVCLLGQSCGSGNKFCSTLGECIAPPVASGGDNSAAAPVALGGLSPGAILGIILAAVVVIIAAIIIALVMYRRRRQEQLEYELTDEMKAGFNIKPSDLSVSKKLGEGSYGVVYLGTYKGKQVAVKRLAVAMFANAVADFLAEAMLIMSVKIHPNVIQTFGMCQERSNLSLVMEYLPGGSLLDLVENESVTITETEIWKFARGIASGMESLASQQIVHRDLACRNILLDEEKTPKVADFGYARVVNQASGSGKTSATVGPIRWMAPEAIGEQVYSEATDVWAFGCVLLELVSRDEPFAGTPIVDVAVNVRDTKKHAPIPSETPAWLRTLMEQCWSPLPKDRPHFSAIVEYLDQHKPGKTKKAHRPSEETSSS
eukprot:TRINITY_DN3388_c0_g2_i1.p1 TRINITY_DN3388_c0_g2~~TRINITY_DN3388_c0_g2_i1.p1  ORF type:complete len:1268 (+),score=125.86 TRINITY_DN3388_c0_g2_i1:130-3933(+)